MSTTKLTEPQKQALARIRNSSKQYVIGVDEVGLGAWAGPLVVCAAVAERDWQHEDVRDSKRVSPALREALVKYTLTEELEESHLTEMSSKDIDDKGIPKCLEEAILTVLAEATANFPDALIVLDGNGDYYHTIRRFFGDPKREIIIFPKADNLVPTVSAASIIAKVYRDQLMIDVDRTYPEYKFHLHKGYGTEKHREMLEEYGPCPIHRMRYKPCREAGNIHRR